MHAGRRFTHVPGLLLIPRSMLAVSGIALPGAGAYRVVVTAGDLLVERAAAIARREKFDASEVRTLFRNAAPTMRVLALGLTQGDPSLADGPVIVDAIANHRSANEQYQGLNLALQCWPQLTAPYRGLEQMRQFCALAIDVHIPRRRCQRAFVGGGLVRCMPPV